MHSLRLLSIGLLLAGTLSSCAVMNDREWDGCAIGGGILGAAVGGITGGVVANNVPDDPDNATRGGAIAGGVVGGGALGAVLGHLICDPEKVVPPPPPPPPAPPASKKVETFQAPFFDFNKSTLRPLGFQKCDHAAGILKAETGNIVITGYTDSIGSDAYNLKLGERRAQSVQKCLVERGVAASRIKVRSKGKADPIASNATEEGRQQNRRVDIDRE